MCSISSLQITLRKGRPQQAIRKCLALIHVALRTQIVFLIGMCLFASELSYSVWNSFGMEFPWAAFARQ